MLIPAVGGPSPHRRDFEETFHVLDREIEVTLRGRQEILLMELSGVEHRTRAELVRTLMRDRRTVGRFP